MTALAQRPANPVVGESVVHESADLHVTGAALYTCLLYTSLSAGVLDADPEVAASARSAAAVLVAAACPPARASTP